MTWSQLLDLAINTAVAGTDADNNPIIKQRLEAGGMTVLALQSLGDLVAGNPEIRARLEKRFSVTLTNGVGAVPAGMLVQYLREGAVRNSDGTNNGLGSFLAKVNRFSNFIQDQNTAFGLCCVVDNLFYARDPGSTDYTSTQGPLIIDAPFSPTTSDLSTTVPDELTSELVELLAQRLKGAMVAGMAPA